MTPLEKLHKIASMVAVEGEADQPINANDANDIVLEWDYEWGWMMTIKNGSHVHLMSHSRFATADEAIEEMWGQVVAKYGEPKDA